MKNLIYFILILPLLSACFTTAPQPLKQLSLSGGAQDTRIEKLQECRTRYSAIVGFLQENYEVLLSSRIDVDGLAAKAQSNYQYCTEGY